MSKTEDGGLEQNTPKERLDRVEKALIKLGELLDEYNFYLVGCDYQNMN